MSGVVGHHTNFTHLSSRVRIQVHTKMNISLRPLRRATGQAQGGLGPRRATGPWGQATCTVPKKYTGTPGTGGSDSKNIQPEPDRKGVGSGSVQTATVPVRTEVWSGYYCYFVSIESMF